MAKETKSKNPAITFHNKISQNFRQVHVDGAYGGITPPGYINLSFYGERQPIPKSTDYSLNDNNALEKVKDNSDSKKGIVREYEFGIYCDLKTAINIRDFLTDRISELEKNLNPTKDAISSK
ncbi:MAG TPA: hypothetical protein VIM16_00705 [Mucilaginibacter sp.]|jgi:hypothetical protein